LCDQEEDPRYKTRSQWSEADYSRVTGF
jgi:hypothetical protein